MNKRIYVIRDERVMLDSDLAELYGIETRILNQQVRRNLTRFPADFIFQLAAEEYEALRSQFATSKVNETLISQFVISKDKRGGRQKQPFVFTENGVAMLSSVLNSERAIQVNIAIMRTFTKLRSYHALNDEEASHLFRIVFERLDGIEEIIKPKIDPHRKKIGLK